MDMTCPPKTDPQVMLEYWIEGSQGGEQEAVYPPQIIGKLWEGEYSIVLHQDT